MCVFLGRRRGQWIDKEILREAATNGKVKKIKKIPQKNWIELTAPNHPLIQFFGNPYPDMDITRALLRLEMTMNSLCTANNGTSLLRST